MRFPSARHIFSNTVLATAITFTSVAAHAFVDVPNAAPVVDLTGTLSAQQQQALANKIADIDSRTGTEVAMLMVPTTGEESVQSYSWRVAEAWKPGHEGINRGLVVVIAKNDRKSFLQVGRGLDQAIPSEQATQLAKNMSPFFRKGQYYEGLDKDLDDVSALAATLPAPDSVGAPQPQVVQTAAPAPATSLDAVQSAVGDPLDFIFKYGVPIFGLAILVQILRWAMSSNGSGYSSSSTSTRSHSVSSSAQNSASSSGSGFATGFVVGAALAESERRSSSSPSSSSSSSSSDYSSSSTSSYSDSSSYSSSDSGGSFGGSGGGDSW